MCAVVGVYRMYMYTVLRQRHGSRQLVEGIANV